MKKLLGVVSIIVFFTNCNNNGGWSSLERQTALKQCVGEVEGKLDDAAAKKYCSCVLEKAMRKYKTYAEANEGTTEEGTELGKACLNVIQGKTDDVGEDREKGGGLFGGGGWSGSDKKKYLNECTPAAANTGIGEQAANTYCNCTLKKFEKKYKSYAEAEKNMTQTELAQIQQECAARSNTNDDGTNDNDNN